MSTSNGREMLPLQATRRRSGCISSVLMATACPPSRMRALRQGFKVSGSDLVWSSNMSRLKKAGARLHLGHSSSNLRDYDGLVAPSAVIKSSAIPADNEEILQAEASGLPVRLAALLKSFAACFNGADYVIITKVYPAREENLWNVHGQNLASSVTGQASEYIPRLEDVINKLFKIFCNRNQGIVIFTLGAGNITTLGSKLLAELKKQTE